MTTKQRCCRELLARIRALTEGNQLCSQSRYLPHCVQATNQSCYLRFITARLFKISCTLKFIPDFTHKAQSLTSSTVWLPLCDRRLTVMSHSNLDAQNYKREWETKSITGEVTQAYWLYCKADFYAKVS